MTAKTRDRLTFAGCLALGLVVVALSFWLAASLPVSLR